MINEYELHQSGISYIQQGYTSDGIELAARKIDEHQLVHRITNELVSEKRK